MTFDTHDTYGGKRGSQVQQDQTQQEVTLPRAGKATSKWSSEKTKLLIEVIKQHQTEFGNRSKRSVWNSISSCMSADYKDADRDSCCKKWSNMLRTYRIFKKRNQSKWPYYEDIGKLLPYLEKPLLSHRKANNQRKRYLRISKTLFQKYVKSSKHLWEKIQHSATSYRENVKQCNEDSNQLLRQMFGMLDDIFGSKHIPPGTMGDTCSASKCQAVYGAETTDKVSSRKCISSPVRRSEPSCEKYRRSGLNPRKSNLASHSVTSRRPLRITSQKDAEKSKVSMPSSSGLTIIPHHIPVTTVHPVLSDRHERTDDLNCTSFPNTSNINHNPPGLALQENQAAASEQHFILTQGYPGSSPSTALTFQLLSCDGTYQLLLCSKESVSEHNV